MSWDNKERRKFVRVNFPCEITTQSASSRRISTYAKNISAGGLRVFLTEKLKISSIVEINIYQIAKEPINCKGSIVWVFSRKDPDNEGELMFDTGIEFSQIKDKDLEEIKKLVTSIIEGKIKGSKSI